MPDGSTPRSSTIRGVVLLGLFDWVRSEHGDAGLTRVREGLPRDMRHRYAGPRPRVIATTPVPASEMAAVAEAIIELWGVEAYHGATAHVAMSDLSTYMKLFLKVGSPTFVVRRLPRVLSHYCNHGELSVDRCERGEARLHITGVHDYGRGVTEGAVGWIRTALEMSGAKGLEIAAELGEGEARYDLRWS